MAPEKDAGGTVWDAPNQQVVREDQSPPWDEGTGGQPGEETPEVDPEPGEKASGAEQAKEEKQPEPQKDPERQKEPEPQRQEHPQEPPPQPQQPSEPPPKGKAAKR